MYIGEEGVGGSFMVGKEGGKGYCGDNNGEGERRLLYGMI